MLGKRLEGLGNEYCADLRSGPGSSWIDAGSKVGVNAAGFQIHSGIHCARPGVHAACYAHGISGRAWSKFGG